MKNEQLSLITKSCIITVAVFIFLSSIVVPISQAQQEEEYFFTLNMYTPALKVPWSEFLKKDWAEIGINLEIHSVDFSVWIESWQAGYKPYDEGGWDMGFDSSWLTIGEPDPTTMYHSDHWPPTGYNFARYSNGKLDELMEVGVVTLDPEERKKITQEAYRIIAEDATVIALFEEQGYPVFSTDLEGVEDLIAWEEGSAPAEDRTPRWATWIRSKSGNKVFVHLNYYRVPGLLPGAPWTEVQSSTFSYLLEPYPDGELVESLATSWEISDDGTAYTYNLREGVKWSDGEPFTSADYVFTIESFSNPDFPTPWSQWMTYIDYVEAPDDYTFIVHTNEPNAIMFNRISGIAPLCKHFLEPIPIETWQESEINTKIGQPSLGPLKYVDAILDEYVEMEPNEHYFNWGKTVHGWTYPTFEEYPWEKVFWRKVPESPAALLMIESGDAQQASWWYRLSSEKNSIEQNPKLQAYPFDTKYVADLFLNIHTPPMNNKNVRQAMNYAIDRQGIIDTLFNGIGNPTSQQITSSSWAWPDEWKEDPYAYDVDKAKELMEKAGYNYEWLEPAKVAAPLQMYAGIAIVALIIGFALGFGVERIRS